MLKMEQLAGGACVLAGLCAAPFVLAFVVGLVLAVTIHAIEFGIWWFTFLGLNA